MKRHRWMEALQVDGDILLTTFCDGECELRESLATMVNADIATSASDYEEDPDFDPRTKAREYIAALRSIAQMVEEKWIVE